MRPVLGVLILCAAGSVQAATYTMKPGDSLYTVAKHHGVATGDLVKANKGVDPKRIHPGTVINLPKTASAKPETPSAKAPPEKTAKTETRTKPTEHTPSSKTAPPSPSEEKSASRTGKNSRTASAKSYKVRSTDSLWTVARRHGLTVSELKQLNGLTRNAIHPGQMLVVSRAQEIPASSKHQEIAVVAATGKERTRKGSETAAHGETVAVQDTKAADLFRPIEPRMSVTRLASSNRADLPKTPLAANATDVRKQMPPAETSEGSETTLAPSAQASAKSNESDSDFAGNSEAIRSGTVAPIVVTLREQSAADASFREKSSHDLKNTPRLSAGDNTPPPSNGNVVSRLMDQAVSLLGTPYRFGAASGEALDCSGFIMQVFNAVGVNMPRTARTQFTKGIQVAKDQLSPGDLLFFRTYASFPSHVGIYIGNGKMIHASTSQRRVTIEQIDSPYFTKRFIGARRLIPG